MNSIVKTKINQWFGLVWFGWVWYGKNWSFGGGGGNFSCASIGYRTL